MLGSEHNCSESEDALVNPRIKQWKEDTWNSIATMTQTPTGLPDDRIDFGRNSLTLKYSGCTSPTNIGLLLDDYVAAVDLGIISEEIACKGIAQIIASVQSMKRPMGMLPNKISVVTGEPVLVDPYSGCDVPQIISSVEMGWFLLGLEITKQAFPQFESQINPLISEMNFKPLFDESTGLFFGHICLETGEKSPHHYDLQNSETRILAYLADIMGLSSKECLSKLVGRPACAPRTNNNGLDVVPSCGGTMFEAAWPMQFFRGELTSPPRRNNHFIYMQRQLMYGGVDCCVNPSLEEADLDPRHRSTEDSEAQYPYELFGIPELGVFPYHLNGVRNPQASLLALPLLFNEAVNNLTWLQINFPAIYKEDFGFMDAVDIRKKKRRVAITQIFPTQAAAFLGIFNRLTNWKMHDYVDAVQPQLTSLLENPAFFYCDPDGI